MMDDAVMDDAVMEDAVMEDAVMEDAMADDSSHDAILHEPDGWPSVSGTSAQAEPAGAGPATASTSSDASWWLQEARAPGEGGVHPVGSDVDTLPSWLIPGATAIGSDPLPALAELMTAYLHRHTRMTAEGLRNALAADPAPVVRAAGGVTLTPTLVDGAVAEGATGLAELAERYHTLPGGEAFRPCNSFAE